MSFPSSDTNNQVLSRRRRRRRGHSSSVTTTTRPSAPGGRGRRRRAPLPTRRTATRYRCSQGQGCYDNRGPRCGCVRRAAGSRRGPSPARSCRWPPGGTPPPRSASWCLTRAAGRYMSLYLYSSCTAAVLCLYSSCTVSVLQLYCSCTAAVLCLYCVCTAAVLQGGDPAGARPGGCGALLLPPPPALPPAVPRPPPAGRRHAHCAEALSPLSGSRGEQ